jgi:hypothetical protein
MATSDNRPPAGDFLMVTDSRTPNSAGLSSRASPDGSTISRNAAVASVDMTVILAQGARTRTPSEAASLPSMSTPGRRCTGSGRVVGQARRSWKRWRRGSCRPWGDSAWPAELDQLSATSPSRSNSRRTFSSFAEMSPFGKRI